MLGPCYTYRDNADLGRLLDAVRSRGIAVRDDPKHDRSLRFVRRFGRVDGQLWDDGEFPVIYLGFGHMLNPFLWPADGALLDAIERTLESNGSRRIEGHLYLRTKQ